MADDFKKANPRKEEVVIVVNQEALDAAVKARLEEMGSVTPSMSANLKRLQTGSEEAVRLAHEMQAEMQNVNSKRQDVGMMSVETGSMDKPTTGLLGMFKKATDGISSAMWKWVEWQDGKKATGLLKESSTAYSQGELTDGFKLAVEGNWQALEHAVSGIKHLITGGERTTGPNASPTTRGNGNSKAANGPASRI